MSEQSLFDLIIIGHHSSSTDLVLVQDILKLLGEHNAQLEAKLLEAVMFKSDRFTLCQHIELKTAMLLQRKLSTLMVKTEVHPTLEPEAKVVALDIYTCSACQHEQPKTEGQNADLEVCSACGVASDQLNAKQALQEMVHVERQRHEIEKSKAISDALKQAKHLEERRFREEARRGSVPAPAQFAKILMGVVGTFTVTVGLGVAYYLVHSTDTPPEPVQAAALPIKQGAAGASGKQDSSNPQAQQASSAALSTLVLADEKPATPLNEAAIEAADKAADSEQTLAKANQPIAKPAEESEHQALFEFQPPSEASIQALSSLDDVQKLQPLSGISSRTLNADRALLQQALKVNDHEARTKVLESVQKPYPRSLLLLEFTEWQIRQKQMPQARQTIEEIRTVLAATRDIDQQVFILGVLSKAYLLVDEPVKAESSLQQGITKAGDVPKRSFQALLLVQLANEQALLGNIPATRKLLKIAEPLLIPAAEVTTNTAKLSQLIALYTLIRDFEEAKSRLPKLENSAKRETLTALIGQLETQID